MNTQGLSMQQQSQLQEILKIEQGLKDYYQSLNAYYETHMNPHELFEAVNRHNRNQENEYSDEELTLMAQTAFEMMNE